MQRDIIVALCSVYLLIGVCVQSSSAAIADFDSLNYPGNSMDIAGYLTGVYGSEVTVENAIVGDGVVHGPLYDYEGDKYIQSSLSLCSDWFAIGLSETPAISVAFDWGKTLNKFYFEVMYVGETEYTEIFSETYGVYTSGVFSTTFDTPVQSLLFHDSSLGEVEIDNLVLTAVPIPSAILLFGSGIISFVGFRRWAYK